MRDSVIQNEHLTRQMDLIDIDRLNATKVVIIGCGAIGSFLALSLVKMGITRMSVFDHDKVDTVNMSNQFFRFKDIGTNKAEALASLIKDFTNVNIMYTPTLFDESFGVQLKDAIVVSAVDSMAARKMIMELAAKFGAKAIIDPRMSAEVYAQYAYEPRNFDKYAKTLYSDADAVQERCTAKSTIYTVNEATAEICATVKKMLMGEGYLKNIQRDMRALANPMVAFASTPLGYTEQTTVQTAIIQNLDSEAVGAPASTEPTTTESNTTQEGA
jgi:molybdopterin/thiamine biosynthesis adenylyltransferase